MLHEAVTLAVSISCPFARANDFLSRPENFPQWASGLSTSLEKTDTGTWMAHTPMGLLKLRFTPPNDFGVIDHFITLESGQELAVPMRVVPNADGCTVMLTLFHTPDMTVQKFTDDQEWVRRDLAALKGVLEA